MELCGVTSGKDEESKMPDVFVRAAFVFVTETVVRLFFRIGSLKWTFGRRGAFVLVNKGCCDGVGAA